MLSPEIIYQTIIATVIPYLPTIFVFGTIILNNIVFGYILMSDCFLKSFEPYTLENY
jgi:hypothetical protein